MGNPLRDRRTPQDFAACGQVIEISEKIGDFEKLAEIVEADLGALEPDKLPRDWRDLPVAGQLGFSFVDAQHGVPALEGQVVATINAVCQRCLEPFRLPLEVDLRLLFGGDQPASAGDNGYEVWELKEDELCPADLIEEALIMAMPYSAMHEDSAQCVKADKTEAGKGETVRPFANLKSQMEEEN
jgi:uncharacterized metal-binding protein YceD (DUF177 family)